MKRQSGSRIDLNRRYLKIEEYFHQDEKMVKDILKRGKREFNLPQNREAFYSTRICLELIELLKTVNLRYQRESLPENDEKKIGNIVLRLGLIAEIYSDIRGLGLRLKKGKRLKIDDSLKELLEEE